MERTVNTKFWTYDQNNSGGSYVIDDNNGVCEMIIIEAISAQDAYKRLESIGYKVSDFWDYCQCCGERWSDYQDDSDGKEEPMWYSQKIDEITQASFLKRCYIHFFDGTFKEVVFKERESTNE